MIKTIATRRTTLNGVTYEKGAPVQMPLQQFEDLEPTGRFARDDGEKKAPTKPKAQKAPPVKPVTSEPPIAEPDSNA